jgi:ATP-binding cassette subfamily B (MDR/TAP) protein 1
MTTTQKLMISQQRSKSTQAVWLLILKTFTSHTPARPHVEILRGLNPRIKPGSFWALVDPSGAGKSIVIALIERFYTPSSGSVSIDGRNTSKLNSISFRDDIALVPQESVLFDGTIRFNLSLGARPNHEPSLEEIETACRTANIHDTISSLPLGYETPCGSNGNQFSGGQMQRVSIARALVQKPRLLLLDESTSALDAESQRLVEEALERTAKDITVIAIAHSLHTIRRADCIFVIEGGKCVDRGTHEDLVGRNETYRENAMHQTLDQLSIPTTQNINTRFNSGHAHTSLPCFNVSSLRLLVHGYLQQLV